MRSSREASRKTSRPFWQSSLTAAEPGEEEKPTAATILWRAPPHRRLSAARAASALRSLSPAQPQQ